MFSFYRPVESYKSSMVERDLEQPNWDYLHLNPQENTCMSFQNNLSTRILEKDNYVTKIPCFTYNMIDNTQNLFTK